MGCELLGEICPCRLSVEGCWVCKGDMLAFALPKGKLVAARASTSSGGDEIVVMGLASINFGKNGVEYVVS